MASKLSTASFDTPQTNFFGAAIFVSYICAALALTFSIVNDLLEKHSHGSVHAKLNLRVVVACVSFTVLSYHMSSFLVASYTTWANNGVLKLDLWNWMIQSSLFSDFAHELISNEWATVWTTAALIWTGAVNIWLAVEGRRHKTKNLWQYFALGQILPISFAQSLFAINLSISRALEQSTGKGAATQEKKDEAPRPKKATSKEHTGNSKGSEDEDEHDDDHIDLNLGPSLIDGPDAAVITFTSIATMYLIYILPSYADKPEFMYMVLATRLLLFAPFIVAMRQEEPEDGGMDPMDATFYVAILIIPIALLIYTTVGSIPASEESTEAAISALHRGMATRALGYDLLIGFASSILMLWGAI